MSAEGNETEVEVRDSGLDMLARKIRLYITTGVVVVTTVAGGSTWAVQHMTVRVEQQLEDTHQDLVALATLQERRFAADSVRNERAFEIVELISAGMLEKEGSPERASAITELRRRRHVIPG